MQRISSGTMARRVLVVDTGLTDAASASVRSVRALELELRARKIDVVEATSLEDGMATMASDSGIHCLLLNWNQADDDKKAYAQATDLLRAVRRRNAKLPIFLMAGRDLAGPAGDCVDRFPSLDAHRATSRAW